ncbi:MAG: hypothetical protein FJY73_13890 [Candidatus Eisenbacteria bacterium]|nr:hypothetical protein [Candidatus Eisenbacteria bacterium]
MRLVILGLLAFLVCGPISAEMLVVLDMDGELGNGPDSVFVEPQDSIAVAVWLVGDLLGADFYGFAVFVVDNGPLAFLGGEILTPAPWVSDLSENGDTVSIVAMHPTLGGSPEGTFLVAILQYVAAAEETLGELGVDLARSGFAVDFGPTCFFDDFVGAKIMIGGNTATEQPTWGAIKTLFR